MAADDAAVVVTLRANLKDYESALKSAVRATERAATNAEKVLSNIGKTAPAGTAIQANFAKSAGAIANDARQLQFQLNDIFSGIASGQGVRAVQQQLGQIAQQLSGGSLVAGARTFGAALAGMVNPINLAVVAFGLATAAAAEYFSSVADGSEETAKNLAKVADEAEKLAKALPASAFGAEFARNARQAANDAEALNAQIKLQEEAVRGSKDAFAELMPAIADSITLLQQAGDTTGANNLTTAYNELKAALESGNGIAQAVADVLAALNTQTLQNADSTDELTMSLKAQQGVFIDAQKNVDDTRIALAAYRSEHSAVIEAQEKGEQAAAKFTNSLIAQDKQIKSLIDTMRSWASIIGALPGALAAVPFEIGPMTREAVKGSPSSAKTFLKSKAASQKVSDRIDQMDDDFASALAELLTILPSSAKIESGVRTTAEQADIWERSGHGTKFAAAPPGKSRHEKGGAADITGVSSDVLQTAVAQIPQLETLKRINDDMHVQLKRGADDSAASATKAKTGYDDLVKSINEKIAAQERENAINSDSTATTDEKTAALQREKAAQEAAKIELQLNQAATAQGIPLTDQLKASNHALAESYAAAGLKADQLATAQKKAAQTAQESAQLTKQINDQFAGIIGGGLSGFVQDLINGEDAGQAFSNMLKRMAGQLADMVIQLLIIKPLMASLTGDTGGGIMGALGFGVAHQGGVVGRTPLPMRLADPRIFTNAPRFATGGIVGLRPGEVPIIAHRGETIVPKGRAVGGGNVSVGSIVTNVNPNAVGAVISTAEQGKAIGRQIEAAVQVILVKESRPGGILRRT